MLFVAMRSMVPDAVADGPTSPVIAPRADMVTLVPEYGWRFHVGGRDANAVVEIVMTPYAMFPHWFVADSKNEPPRDAEDENTRLLGVGNEHPREEGEPDASAYDTFEPLVVLT